MKNFDFLTVVLILFLFIPGLIAQETTYPTIKFGGRIHYDLEFIRYGEETLGGQEFRRMMVNARGNVSDRVGYKIHFDFNGGRLGFRDVYLKLGQLPFIGGHLYIGNFAEPTGLDMLTSSNYISFIERAMLTSTQGFRWNSGFQYANHGLLNDNMGLQLAYTFNGDRNRAFIDDRLLEGGNFIGRVYATPYTQKEKNRLVHLAFQYERRDHPDDRYNLSFFPETHFLHRVSYTDSLDIQNDFGAELAATFGPVSVQGEYELSSQVVGDERYFVQGYYAYLSFFLTGEHRSYKEGVFSRVKPKNEFCALENKWGAVELLARYSVMDFSEAAGLASFDGAPLESVTNLTFGLNWYLNKYTRIMYNYVWSDLSTDVDHSSHLIRTQIDF
jgi:phosphate-selective porin OprO/OprP